MPKRSRHGLKLITVLSMVTVFGTAPLHGEHVHYRINRVAMSLWIVKEMTQMLQSGHSHTILTLSNTDLHRSTAGVGVHEEAIGAEAREEQTASGGDH